MPSHQEQSTTDIWRAICISVQRAISQHNINPNYIRGIGFDATCSLAVFHTETDEPVSVTGPNFDTDRNVILWLDHRPEEETEKINATKHNLLRYVGGKMSIEMEVPKVLWLKNHMPRELFEKCKFYDLADALIHIATGTEKRSFCSVVCKQGYVPVGVDGSVKGWQDDFLREIGLGELVEENYKRLGGVNGVVSLLLFRYPCFAIRGCELANDPRTANISVPASWRARSAKKPPQTWVSPPASPSVVASSMPTQDGSERWAQRST